MFELDLPKQFFVTGTDTEVGKTYCSSLIVKHMMAAGIDVFPFKPIAAGVEPTLIVNNTSVNEDAYELWQAVDKRFSLEQINPILLQEPIAPHIAANNEGVVLDTKVLEQLWHAKPQASHYLVEGAGGWMLPLNHKELMSDWVVQQSLPVILVVGVKLGCLNHALLTVDAIHRAGGNVHGWIANFIHGETFTGRENVAYLTDKLASQYGVKKLFEVQQGQTELQ